MRLRPSILTRLTCEKWNSATQISIILSSYIYVYIIYRTIKRLCYNINVEVYNSNSDGAGREEYEIKECLYYYYYRRRHYHHHRHHHHHCRRCLGCTPKTETLLPPLLYRCCAQNLFNQVCQRAWILGIDSLGTSRARKQTHSAAQCRWIYTESLHCHSLSLSLSPSLNLYIEYNIYIFIYYTVLCIALRNRYILQLLW